MPSLCRTKHNRAKPMSELPSAMFLIADGSEFRFARFYIVCEEVPLGTPESPPIVSGVSDMHPADCQNVEETRNPMQKSGRKKCSHFSPTNVPSAFPSEIERHDLFLLLLSTNIKRGCPLKASSPFRLFLTLTHPQMRRQRLALCPMQFPLRCPPSRLPLS